MSRAGAPGGGRKPVDQTRSAEGEERWTETWYIRKVADASISYDTAGASIIGPAVESVRVVRASRIEEVQTERDQFKMAFEAEHKGAERAEAQRDEWYEALESMERTCKAAEADLERAQELFRDLHALFTKPYAG